MRIAIAGAGAVGRSIAQELLELMARDRDDPGWSEVLRVSAPLSRNPPEVSGR